MPRHPEPSRPRGVIATARGARFLVAAAGAALLAGCTALAPAPTGTDGGTAGPTSTPEPSSTSSAPSEPVLVVGGSAAENLPVFTSVTNSVWSSEQRESGRAYVDALVATGFDKAAMQVTEDFSTVGNPAESIQFSVRWGDECLIGQVGSATGEPVTVVAPVLAEGTCLIGQTRSIDW
ncbi:DUF6993 domain-containing protein [Microbacterium sp. I2]|uniref:DUF6993 domain-containing protein n=1 Tax=Microbacterium sp. I2 TaxID=3391826 RepID=UPI003EDADEF7